MSENNMTNNDFEHIKARVIEELLGPGIIEGYKERKPHRMIDEHFESGESWLDRPRMTSPMNIDASSIRKYQEQITKKGRIDVIVQPETIAKSSARFVH